MAKPVLVLSVYAFVVIGIIAIVATGQTISLVAAEASETEAQRILRHSYGYNIDPATKTWNTGEDFQFAQPYYVWPEPTSTELIRLQRENKRIKALLKAVNALTEEYE